MNPLRRVSRREILCSMALAGLGAPFARRTIAEERPASESARELQLVPREHRPQYPARRTAEGVIQPARPLPILEETDVLVVGGGAAGVAAAVAAARAGVRTALIERYGFFGGLWSGGMVLYVMGTHAVVGGQLRRTLRGIGGELLDRLARMDGAIIHHRDDRANPTSDPEATKIAMDEMVGEAGVRVLFHCWATDVVMDGDRPCGVVVDGKSGRQAVLGKVLVDATGDGDVFAAAGAEHEQRLHAIGLVHRLGNVDRVDRERLRAAGVTHLGGVTPLPSVTWVNLRGPSANALDIRELTRLEIEHRRAIWRRVVSLRQKPGGEPLFLLDTAPQLGVRISRILAGEQTLTRAEARTSRRFPNTIGVGGDEAGKGCEWPIPYGVLVPKKLDGLLAAGRCVSVDEKLIESMRLIAACLVTGHAAGAAAALAVKDRCEPRQVDIPKLQALLREQGAYLG
ncbi:MAG: FAD-dependent oxidoreductase [Kiritimatiellae bacterium]|nr:FAD-dependent oxidoreductase [Kiritimatiellia bacterium]